MELSFLEALRKDRDNVIMYLGKLEDAITAVEQLQELVNDVVQNPAPAEEKTGRRKMTLAQRKAVGRRMKKYWAKQRALRLAK